MILTSFDNRRRWVYHRYQTQRGLGRSLWVDKGNPVKWQKRVVQLQDRNWGNVRRCYCLAGEKCFRHRRPECFSCAWWWYRYKYVADDALQRGRSLPRPDHSASGVAQALAKGALLGARGNSGVILSQIFRGMAEDMADKEEITGPDMARALAKPPNRLQRTQQPHRRHYPHRIKEAPRRS